MYIGIYEIGIVIILFFFFVIDGRGSCYQLSVFFWLISRILVINQGGMSYIYISVYMWYVTLIYLWCYCVFLYTCKVDMYEDWEHRRLLGEYFKGLDFSSHLSFSWFRSSHSRQAGPQRLECLWRTLKREREHSYLYCDWIIILLANKLFPFNQVLYKAKQTEIVKNLLTYRNISYRVYSYR